MPNPESDETILLRGNHPTGARANGNGAAHSNGTADATPAAQSAFAPIAKAMPAFLGTLAALLVFAFIGLAGYFGYSAIKSMATAKSAPTAPTAPQPVVKSTHPLNDPSTWELSAEPAQNLTGDGSADIGWWARTFDLPSQGKVADYLKTQGITVSSIVPLHYDDTKDATTITYQIEGEVPDELLRVPRATWAPTDPDLRPFAGVLVLVPNLPAGQFWNSTGGESVAAPAGTKLDFAWKVQWNKNANTVTADRLPYSDDVFTPQQVAQFQAETSATVNQLRSQVQAIDARVQGEMQVKLAQIPANPPKPDLMSGHWNHGDGSGEPTKSAERMGGGTLAGAAGGAAFGAAAGDAGMGAGIGAGVGLLGGFIYDTVSKNNDRHRYENHAAAVNGERMREWRAQVRALDKQRDQIKQAGDAEKQQLLQELANRIAAAGGRVDGIPVPADIPPAATPVAEPVAPAAPPPLTQSTTPPATPPPADTPTYSDAPQAQPPPDQPTPDQPSGAIR